MVSLAATILAAADVSKGAQKESTASWWETFSDGI